MKKKVLSILLTALLTLGVFGCNSATTTSNTSVDSQEPTIDASSSTIAPATIEESEPKEEPISLKMYTIGNPPKDLDMVNEELSNILMELGNIKIDRTVIGWGDYEQRLNTIINTGEYFDIIYSYGNPYLLNAQKGGFLALDDLLQNEGKEIMDTVNPLYWKGVTIGGKIYGIPTNKEIATPRWWMYPAELVKKYNIDIDNIKTLADLEPVLEMLKENEPEWQLMQLNQDSSFMYGFEAVVGSVAAVNLNDINAKVVNLYEQPKILETAKIIRKYYQAGYINADAATKEQTGLTKDEKVFWKEGQGGPYSDIIWSNDRGYEVTAVQIEDAIATTESTRGAIMSIFAKSKYPEKAMEFLKYLNTNAEVRNMINFGIKGIHYELTSDQRVRVISDTYKAPQYTLQNLFILYPLETDPLDKWEQFGKFNSLAKESPLLGFVPDTTRITGQLGAIENVCDEFRAAIMTGSVDPESYLNKFNEKLYQSGLEEVIYQLQKQIDAYLASK